MELTKIFILYEWLRALMGARRVTAQCLVNMAMKPDHVMSCQLLYFVIRVKASQVFI